MKSTTGNGESRVELNTRPVISSSIQFNSLLFAQRSCFSFGSINSALCRLEIVSCRKIVTFPHHRRHTCFLFLFRVFLLM
jgi:hypothetical protein